MRNRKLTSHIAKAADGVRRTSGAFVSLTKPTKLVAERAKQLCSLERLREQTGRASSESR